MLGKGLTKYVRKEKQGYTNATRSIYDKRLEVTVKLALKDLALCCEKLSEEDLAKLFTEESLRPFFSALLSLRKSDEAKRTRLIGIWRAVFNVLTTDYGVKIVNAETWKALTYRYEDVLRAVFYAAEYGNH